MSVHTDLFGKSWSQTWHLPAPFFLLVNPRQEDRQRSLLRLALGLDPTVGLAQGYNALLTGSRFMIQISEQAQVASLKTSVESVWISSDVRFPVVKVKHHSPALGDDLD